METFYKNKLDEQYIEIAKDVIDNGIESLDRTGTGTKRWVNKSAIIS
jgi:thymidylate synthase